MPDSEAHQLDRRAFLRTTTTALVAASAVPLAMPGTASAAASGSPREQVDLAGGWRFHLGDVPGAQWSAFDDSSWGGVSVPHTWNALDGQDGGGNLVTGGSYYRGVGWYRYRLDVPAGLAGRRLFLQFDGSNLVTDVWVNDVYLGRHQGGYARFRFDATAALRAGSVNMVAVKVNNVADPSVAPLSADYTFDGGLYRGVSLQVTAPVHIDLLDYAGPGVYLRQRAVTGQSAQVDITTKLVNDSGSAAPVSLRTTISDGDGGVVWRQLSNPVPLGSGGRTQSTQSARITSPRLWNGRRGPQLYEVLVEVLDGTSGAVVDSVRQPLGLRSFAVSPATGFSLNGAPYPLRGVSRHQDRLNKGFAISDADTDQDFQLMHDMGVNALRTAHYEQSQRVYQRADELGIVIYTEVPLVNEITDSDAFRANIAQQLRETIRQNYNHPSVVCWGIGNEQGSSDHTKDAQTSALLEDLAKLVVAEDPDRVSGYANVMTRTDDDAFTSHADLTGYNKYYGWYTGSAEMFGPWADELHAADPTRKIGVTEYGAGGSIYQHQEMLPAAAAPDPFGPWHPEEYQAQFHEVHLKQIEARPYLWGTFVWNMFDFASDGRNEGDHAGRNDKGLVTYDRAVKKDAYYWYQVNWTDTPVTYLTSRRWVQRTNPATTVKVYSNAPQVTLTVNGVEIGTKSAPDHIFTWPVTLAPGTNRVTATSTNGGTTQTDTVTWVVGP